MIRGFSRVLDRTTSATFAIGVLGDTADPKARRFLDMVKSPGVLVTDERIEVRASGEVQQRNESVTWGSVFPASAEVKNWRALSEAAGLAGLTKRPDGWCLFTDSLGLHPVYHRTIGDITYFASNIDLLVIEEPLTADWEAWASTMVLGATIGQSTAFREIRRLQAASGLIVNRHGVAAVNYEPDWFSYQGAGTPAQLIETLEHALPDIGTPAPADIPISGGWDSRLLAGLAVEKFPRRLRSWTTGQDDGRELDLAFAPDVAEALRLRHKIVRQPASGWPELAIEARSRMQYETWMHVWLIPLARVLHRRSVGVIDGLAGDVLVKGLFVDRHLLGLGSAERLDLAFQRIGGRADRFLPFMRPDIAESVVGSARAAFQRVAERYEGHINQVALAVLNTRTSRAISLAPLRLFGPETKVWMPYVHPRFMGISLAIDPHVKLDGALSRELLRLVAPSIAELPSTNDSGRKPARTLRRLSGSPEAVSWMVETILASESARSLFHHSAIDEMQEGLLTADRAGFEGIKVLQAASLLAEWELIHQHTVDPDAPDWLTGG